VCRLRVRLSKMKRLHGQALLGRNVGRALAEKEYGVVRNGRGELWLPTSSSRSPKVSIGASSATCRCLHWQRCLASSSHDCRLLPVRGLWCPSRESSRTVSTGGLSGWLSATAGGGGRARKVGVWYAAPERPAGDRNGAGVAAPSASGSCPAAPTRIRGGRALAGGVTPSPSRNRHGALKLLRLASQKDSLSALSDTCDEAS